MDKNKALKLGLVGLVAAVGYTAYSTIKRARLQQDQEIIDISPEEPEAIDTQK